MSDVFRFAMNGPLFWLIVAVALFVVEGLTVQLVSIWFAIGALITAFLACFGMPAWSQAMVFILASAICILLLRPFTKNVLKVRKQPTNSDRVIGQVGVVLEEIDNLKQQGRVSVYDLNWTARSYRGGVIPEGTRVVVVGIDGVKVIVDPVKEPEEVTGSPQGSAPSDISE